MGYTLKEKDHLWHMIVSELKGNLEITFLQPPTPPLNLNGRAGTQEEKQFNQSLTTN